MVDKYFTYISVAGLATNCKTNTNISNMKLMTKHLELMLRCHRRIVWRYALLQTQHLESTLPKE